MILLARRVLSGRGEQKGRASGCCRSATGNSSGSSGRLCPACALHKLVAGVRHLRLVQPQIPCPTRHLGLPKARVRGRSRACPPLRAHGPRKG
eukprot:scaffold30108_cov31-Tisochrysis_lutea.AAC.3